MANKRVLIVDDAKIMRARIKSIAISAGWEVCGEAGNGAEAVEMYHQTHPDLVTLDIVMPIMDGVTALAKLREHDANAKIVMVTAVDQRQKLNECIRLGALDFVVKPYDAETLKAFFVKYGSE